MWSNDPGRLEKKPWPLWVYGSLAVGAGVSLFCCLPIGWNVYSEMNVVSEADSEQLQVAATAFGRRVDQLGCEEESLARLDRCTAQTKQMTRIADRQAHQKQCLAETVHFHRYCLDAAKPNPQFCGRLTGKDALAGAKLEAQVCRNRYPTFEAPGCRQVVQQSWLRCQLGSSAKK